MIRTLIVDDEPLACEGLRVRLRDHSDVEIVGEAGDGPAAVEMIQRQKPDLVLLDVQMPGLDGFQVLERVSRDVLPMVVFVTAFDQHAIRAFEAHAVDYLLKPVAAERLGESLRRVREELSLSETFPGRRRIGLFMDAMNRPAAAHGGGSAEAAQSTERPRRFTVKDRDRILLVRSDEIEAVEAAGNYVVLVTGPSRYLLRATLADMERDLDPTRFARIHRSTIVSIDRVREIRPEAHGDCVVLLESGLSCRMSRAYRHRLLPP